MYVDVECIGLKADRCLDEKKADEKDEKPIVALDDSDIQILKTYVRVKLLLQDHS